MASAWGNSWGSSWGDSWGTLTEVTAPTYYLKLGGLGFAGALPDRQAAYLQSLGHTGAMNDKISKHLRNLGYTGDVPCMLKQKANAESFSSINKMMEIQGLIPV